MEIKEKIQKNVVLAPLTTFKIGGPARYFIEIKNKTDFLSVLEWAKIQKIEAYILGGGSNVLINDKGIDGLVLWMKNDNIEIKGERLECGAGAMLMRAVTLAKNASLSGLEWGTGIPRATIGGVIRGNAGAFGQKISDVVETVEIFNQKRKSFETYSNRLCQFGYRQSIFKIKSNLWIWGASLKLRSDNNKKIGDLMEKNLKFRENKYPRLPSAGSIFKNVNPDIIREANPIFFEKEIKKHISKNNRVGAGLLIDLAGLKGKSMGGIKISLEHANHIVNTGQGTAEQVIMLISFIKQQIRTKFKVQLEEEIVFLGF